MIFIDYNLYIAFVGIIIAGIIQGLLTIERQ
jgi:hypothetical protein